MPNFITLFMLLNLQFLSFSQSGSQPPRKIKQKSNYKKIKNNLFTFTGKMAVSHDDKLLSDESFPSSNQPHYNWMEVTQDFLSGCKGKIYFKSIK